MNDIKKKVICFNVIKEYRSDSKIIHKTLLLSALGDKGPSKAGINDCFQDFLINSFYLMGTPRDDTSSTSTKKCVPVCLLARVANW